MRIQAIQDDDGVRASSEMRVQLQRSRALSVRCRAHIIRKMVQVILSVVALASPLLPATSAAQVNSAAEGADGTWLQLPPPKTWASTMVYDSWNDRFIVYTGTQLWSVSVGLDDQWTALLPEGPTPGNRYGASAIYDPVGQRMVLFGGTHDGQLDNDVWSLSLFSDPVWEQMLPGGAAPAPRNRHTAVYDPVDQRMIVYGGHPSRGDVWALSLDGQPTWSEIVPTGGQPLGRDEHAAVYDSSQHRMIVLGGYGPGATLGDVWALNLSYPYEWSQINPEDTWRAPYSIVDHVMAYDANSTRLLVYGGRSANGDWLGTYQLDLSSVPRWVSTPLSSWPFSRYNHCAAYDSRNDRMMMLGGYAPGYAEVADFWALDLTNSPNWIPIDPVMVRESGRAHSSVLDTSRNEIVVFGGEPDYQTLSRTVSVVRLGDWPEWRNVEIPGIAPSARKYHVAAYDPVGDRLIVHGGYSASWLRDTWALSLGEAPSWQLLSNGQGPSTSYSRACAYDSQRRRALMLTNNTLWSLALDGTEEWSSLATTNMPGAVANIVYDAQEDRIIGYSGYDTWILSLDTLNWERVNVAGAIPPARSYGSSLVLDNVGRRLLLHGGFGGHTPEGWEIWYNDVWELQLDGTPTWRQLMPNGAKSSSADHSAVYDTQGDRMVVIGGYRDASWHNDVSVLSFGGQPQPGWPIIPGTRIVVRVEEIVPGGEVSVATARLAASGLESIGGDPGIAAPVQGGFAVFGQAELAELLSDISGVNRIDRIELFDAQGNLLGHVKFRYALIDLSLYQRSIDVVVFLHDNYAPAAASHLGGWDYYQQGEHPVSMLIPPGMTIDGAQGGSQHPVIFVHGLAGTFNYWGTTPESLDPASFDAWRFCYPYDQWVDTTANMLSAVIPRLLDGQIVGVDAYVGQRPLSIVAHSMGGLVARKALWNADTAQRVRKLAMIATPNHGSYGAWRLAYDQVNVSLMNMLASDADIFTVQDPDAPAHIELTPGSEWLWSLNNTPMTPLGANDVALDYLVVAGKDDMTRLPHREIESQDDGVVSVSSASLTDMGVPLAIVDRSHTNIHTSDVTKWILQQWLPSPMDASGLAAHEGVLCVAMDPGSEACDTVNGLDTGLGLLVAHMDNVPTGTTHYRMDGVVELNGVSRIQFTKNGDLSGSYDSEAELLRIRGTNNFFSRCQRGIFAHREIAHWLPEDPMPIALVEDGMVTYSTVDFSARHFGTTHWHINRPPFAELAVAAPNREELNPAASRGSLEYPHVVDPSITAVVYSIIGDDIDELTRPVQAYVVDPDGRVVDEAAAAADPSIMMQMDSPQGPMRIVVSAPNAGTWKVGHSDLLAGSRVLASVFSGNSAQFQMPDEVLAVGDSLTFSVVLSVQTHCLDTKAVAVMALWTPVGGGVPEPLGPVPLSEDSPGVLTGEILAVEGGVYDLMLDFSCQLADGAALTRSDRVSVWVSPDPNSLTATPPAGPPVVSGPSRLEILGITPNPFNARVSIIYEVLDPGRGTVGVYSISGRRIKTLVSGPLTRGIHTQVWSGRDESGREVASGVYLIRASDEHGEVSRKVVLLK